MSLEWQAVYHDGTFLSQYNADKTENKYSDIDRSKLAEFRLYRENGELSFSLILDDNQRLVYRRRVFKQQNIGTENVIYLVGWQMTVHGENIQSINYINETGSAVVASGKFKEDSRIFYSIVQFDFELG